MSEQPLLAGALVVIGALLVAGLLLTFGHAAARAVRDRLLAPRVADARRAIAEAVDTGALTPAGAGALRRLPFGVRLGVFADVAPSLRGEPRASITRAARETGLIAGAERRCASRSWRRRFRAVRLLTVLGGGEHAVPPLLADPTVEVRVQAAEWAAEHRPAENLDALVAMLGDAQLLARFTVQEALTRVGRAAGPALQAAIGTAQGDELVGALRVAAGIAEPGLTAAAIERAGDPHARGRAAVADLLGAGGGQAAIAALQQLLEDDDARVRAAAAHALGRLGHWPAAARLAEHLHDAEWEVRRRSALALRAFGPVGAVMLRRAARDEHSSARDIATLALELPDTVVSS
ncbi:MAG: hypothetical protein QOC64_3561 [Solirubrobacteraceae bacterium]|nr:hypothetical protein [Solirubrobacteraceae bacterium]